MAVAIPKSAREVARIFFIGAAFVLLGRFLFNCSENVVVVSNWWGTFAQYNEKCYNQPHE